MRNAVNCGNCHANAAEGRAAVDKGDFVDLTKKLVVYTDTGADPVELPKVLANNPRLMLLEGGYQAWRDEVLAKVSFENVTDQDRLYELQQREAVRAFFSGERPSTAGAVAPLPTTPSKGQRAQARRRARGLLSAQAVLLAAWSKAALTMARASSWMRARCSGPRKLSA